MSSTLQAQDERKGISLPTRVIVSLRAGVILAIANVLCVCILSWAYMHTKAEPKVISVTGSAKKAIQSDLIVWSADISADDANLPAAYSKLKDSTDRAMQFLKSKGIAPEQITVSSISTEKHYVKDAKGNNTDQVSSYELKQNIQVSSGEVARIDEVGRTITELIKDGVMLESHEPQYIYTKLADLKITMLAEATKDATTRARQIAANSGAKLGSIREARMGVMQITARYDNDVSDYGMNDTSSFEKEITAVVSARFALE